MKSLVIRGMQMGWKSWARHEVLIASRGPLPLELLVRQVTGEPHPMFALSVGNQRTMRKLTVLAMRPDGEILGYMKLPLTDAATQRVRNEAAILQRLWNYPALRPHLPRILYAGSYNESYLLFQSPSMGPLGPTGLVGIHEKFLQVLWGVHRAERPGKLLIEEVALQWEQCAAQRENEWEELGQEVLRRSTRALGQVTIPSGVMHGDFAPWNTRVEHGRLFLFDWESAAWEAPIAWDIFHFQVQTACFLKKGRGFSGRQWEGTEEMSFLLYLLSSAAQLIAEGADRTGINYRRELLTKCLSEKTSQEAVGVPAGRKRWDSAITKGLYD